MPGCYSCGRPGCSRFWLVAGDDELIRKRVLCDRHHTEYITTARPNWKQVREDLSTPKFPGAAFLYTFESYDVYDFAAQESSGKLGG